MNDTMSNNRDEDQTRPYRVREQEFTVPCSNSIKIKGHSLTKGRGEGEIIATTVPLSFWGGFDPSTGKIVDRHHPLSGCKVSKKVLVLPRGRGSSSGSGVLLEAIIMGTAPSAILMNKMDEIIALGAIVCDEVFSQQLPILVLNDDSFKQALNASYAYIETDESVTIRW